MRKHLLTVLGIASALVLFGASIASAGSIELRADVPFNFMAGDKMLPAGTYNVSRPGTFRTALTIKGNAGGHGGVIVRTNMSQPANTTGTTKLVFNRYGNQYFLSQVWTSAKRDGYVYVLPKSEREREIAKELSANRNQGPEVVSIAASLQ